MKGIKPIEARSFALDSRVLVVSAVDVWFRDTLLRCVRASSPRVVVVSPTECLSIFSSTSHTSHTSAAPESRSKAPPTLPSQNTATPAMMRGCCGSLCSASRSHSRW